MTKRQLKELQEVRRTALPKVEERIVVVKQDKWKENLERQLEEERYGL